MNNLISVKDAIWIKDFLFYVELSDDSRGIVDFQELVDKHPMFKQIVDDDKQEYYAVTDNYTIEWYNGADIAPEWIKEHLH
ncbi:TPA: DUF2442 domain-containing protein [Vibrio parahaemolyticus]